MTSDDANSMTSDDENFMATVDAIKFIFMLLKSTAVAHDLVVLRLMILDGATIYDGAPGKTQLAHSTSSPLTPSVLDLFFTPTHSEYGDAIVANYDSTQTVMMYDPKKKVARK